MENKLIPNLEKKELISNLPKPIVMHEKPEYPEPIIIIEGNITEWTFNTEYIYDGFILETNSDKISVKFPPHLGKQLKDSVNNTSNFVSIKGVLHTKPKGEKEIKFVSLQSSDKEIYDTPPIHSHTPPEFFKGEGKVTQILQEKRGEIIGYIIDDATIIKIHPHENAFFENKIQINFPIKFTGIKKANKEGEVKAKDYSIIQPKTITIDEKEYLLK